MAQVTNQFPQTSKVDFDKIMRQNNFFIGLGQTSAYPILATEQNELTVLYEFNFVEKI